MLPFIRSDINQLQAYKPHPGGKVDIPLDQLDTNESPFDLPLELKGKLTSLYQQEIRTNRYPDGAHIVLKQKIATYVNESASLMKGFAEEHISVGNGSDELIRSVLIATCLGKEGSILVANPTFSMYGILAKTLGIPVVSIERRDDNFAWDLDQAEEAIENTNSPPIKVVFVVHPNSPTANALTPEEITWLRNLPQNILVVIDEAYFEFSQTSLAGELKTHPNWIILRTFSKAFRLAAHRVGYAIAHPEMIITLEKVRLPYNLPSFSQAAAKIALDFRELLLATIPETIEEKQKLFEALSQNTHLKVWPSSANFLYLQSKTNLQQLAQNLKEKGTLIRHTGGGLRVTVGSAQENERTIARFNQTLANSI